MIPKIIHQTWNDNPLPSILKYIRDENIKLLKDCGYEFILWTDAMILKLINENYPDMYKIYNETITGVQRGDIARIIILYHFGGVYIDLDILFLKDINTLIDFSTDKFYISFEPKEQTEYIYKTDRYLCNAFFASNKNNIFLYKLIHTIPDIINSRGIKILSKFDVFGGGYIMGILTNDNDSLNIQEHVNIIYDRELIYPINDLKLENLAVNSSDWRSLKNGKYLSDPYMIHYWIHGDFESKNLLNVFKPDIDKDIHHNMYVFFYFLYNDLAKKYM